MCKFYAFAVKYDSPVIVAFLSISRPSQLIVFYVASYSGAEIWEQEELLTTIKCEPYTRNRAALALMWDFNARNH